MSSSGTTPTSEPPVPRATVPRRSPGSRVRHPGARRRPPGPPETVRAGRAGSEDRTGGRTAPLTRPDRRRLHHHASHAVTGTTQLFGSLSAVALSVGIVVVWLLGTVFHVRWMGAVTSLTTVVTFLMVVVVQSTQNRESRAVQTKLDALLIAEERLDERELLGLERQPDPAIRDVQTGVHGGPVTGSGGAPGA